MNKLKPSRNAKETLVFFVKLITMTIVALIVAKTLGV